MLDGDHLAERPLTGLRVVELAHIMAGPVCGLMLADLGADVVKVEKLDGDDSRRFVPPEVNGESAAFMMLNRNKRGIALDLKDAGAKAALKALLASTDIVVENYRHDTMERLGLSYETLRADNPRLVYCAVSGFGRTGPYATRGGFDLIAQGMSGLMAITGEGPGHPPVKVGAPISDITAGILAALGCLAAYTRSQRTGAGGTVDTSLHEAAIVQTYWQSAIAFATGTSPEPMGSAHPLNAPYQAFRTSDGWINVGAANQKNWMRLLDALDAMALADDPRFATNHTRMTNRAALESVLEPYLATRTTAEWLEAFEEAGLPAGPVLSIIEMHEDPQVRARNMVLDIEHPKAGPTRALGAPIKFGETAAHEPRPAPLLGQHTREILREAGLAEGAVEDLIARGAAVAPDA